MVKTTPERRTEIIALYKTGRFTHKRLANAYGLHYATIARIISPKQFQTCMEHSRKYRRTYMGKVRGFLCRNCNHMLGLAKDNKHILRSAERYLGVL